MRFAYCALLAAVDRLHVGEPHQTDFWIVRQATPRRILDARLVPWRAASLGLKCERPRAPLCATQAAGARRQGSHADCEAQAKIDFPDWSYCQE